jgi:hypothetical protein
VNEWEWQLLEDKTPVESMEIQGAQVRRGDRVRLRPRAGGDVFDLALEGKIAAVESIEQDYEGKLHVCVVVEDDPGRDIGLMRQPGHRFFFAPEELRKPRASSSRELATFSLETTVLAWKLRVGWQTDCFRQASEWQTLEFEGSTLRMP